MSAARGAASQMAGGSVAVAASRVARVAASRAVRVGVGRAVGVARRVALCALFAVTAAGCGVGAPEAREAPATVQVATGPAHPLPQGAADRFGFGSAASEARVGLWDRDVRPDGAGLPPGGGTAREGAAVYAAKCAACHGPTGTEGPNDRLAGGTWEPGAFPSGRTVGSYWPYATTVFDYVTRAMPQERPGSLTADETYAVVAWILHRNGLIGEDDRLDATTLPAVAMPARDRFVPDDRTGGPTIR